MDRTLTTHFDQKKFLTSWNQNKKALHEHESMMKRYVEEETKDELKAIELAMKKYEDKVNTVMKKPDFVKMKEQTAGYAEKVNQHLAKAVSIFEKERRKILDDPNRTPDDKQKSIKKIYDYILTKLYTKDEIRAFENQTVMLLIR